MQMGNMLLLLVLLLPSIAIAQSICPEDGDSCWGGLGTNVGNKCYYFVNGNSEEVNEKDPSPYNNPTPDRCGSYRRCSTEVDAVKASGSFTCDSDKIKYMCETCADGWAITKYAEGTTDSTSCPINLHYADDCYKRETWTNDFPAACPYSEHRQNQCYYKTGQSWGSPYAANKPETAPVPGCRSYTLCSGEFVKDTKLQDPNSDERKIETYWAMCNECLETHYAAEFNIMAKGSCSANAMVTKCTEGTRPTPVDPPPGPAPTPAPAPQISCNGVFQRMLGCDTESWMVAMFFAVFVSFMFLVCYIFYAKRKRQKKKIRRIKEEAKLKQKAALAEAKAIEMKSKYKSVRGSKSGKLSPEELAAKEEEKERKREEMKKRREEKEAILHSAFEDGLPPNWEVFTDPTYNQIYYVNVATGETSWTRPTVEKVVEVEKQVMTENPLQSEENEQLKKQMKMLVDQNRNLKKQNMEKDKTSLGTNIPIREAKKKKAAGMWKSGIAKAKMQAASDKRASGGGATGGLMKAVVDAANAEKAIADANAMVPKAPGPPPPGPKPGEKKEGGDNQV